MFQRPELPGSVFQSGPGAEICPPTGVLTNADMRYRAIFEQVPDGIVVLDPGTGRFVAFNEAAHLQLGYTRYEFAQMTLADIAIVESADYVAAHLARMVRRGRTTYETKCRCKSGEIRDVVVHAKVSSFGGREYLIGVSSDITEVVRTREAISARLKENRRLTRKVMEAQESERQHLGAELHDDLGPWIAALQVHAQVVKRLAGRNTPDLAASADGIIQAVEHIQFGFRRIIDALRPTLLAGLSFYESINELIENVTSSAPQLSVDLSITDDIGTVSVPVAIAAYRVVQEALANVIKHSAAQCATVQLRVLEAPGVGASLLITVRDRGIGMDCNKRIIGFGIIGMRERAEALGGTFRLRSRPGHGVCVRVRLPLTNIARSA